MRPPNRPARALAVLCLAAAPLAGCAGDPERRDVVAPIVLSEETSSSEPRGDDRTETGASPVDPPDPEPAGPEPDAVRRPVDDDADDDEDSDDDSDDGADDDDDD